MGGLKENSGNVTFVGITKGNLAVRQQDGTVKAYRSLGGIVKKVTFAMNTPRNGGNPFETANFLIDNNGEAYVLSLFVDSRYFLSLCNFLKNADLSREVEISPSEKTNEEGKKIQTCFVKQDDKNLRAAYTKDNLGDMPQLEVRQENGKTVYDNSAQIQFWKQWLLSVLKTDEPQTQSKAFNEPVTDTQAQQFVDDLPF